MGRNLGLPGNSAQHLRVIRAALALLNHADEISTMQPFEQ
jgi:hypothetical protein